MRFAAGQSAFADALLDPSRPLPPGLTTARGVGDPARFAVYRNNLFVGMTRALAKGFPVVERLVGADFFAGMARVYAGLERPASPLLFEYGAGFPEFIADFEPARTVPYLADVARVERAWLRAYNARDTTPLTIAGLAETDPADLATLRLAPHPSVALVRSSHAVGSIWAAHQAERVEPLQTDTPESVLIVRPEMEVCVHVIPPRDAAFAAALLRGESLGAAAEAGLAADQSFDFGEALVGLVSLGTFSANTTMGESRT